MYWKELSSRGKRDNIWNWTLEEWILTVFLNFFPFFVVIAKNRSGVHSERPRGSEVKLETR